MGILQDTVAVLYARLERGRTVKGNVEGNILFGRRLFRRGAVFFTSQEVPACFWHANMPFFNPLDQW